MTRLLIIDDSPTVRRRLAFLFEAASDFQVVGEVATGAEALRRLHEFAPDLICLDVFLAAEDAAALVPRLLRARPVPIVLVSDAPRGSPEVFDALEAGALELVKKPKPGDVTGVNLFLQTIRRLSLARRLPGAPEAVLAPAPRLGVVVVGASTGGPGPLRQLVGGLPSDFPAPIVIAQHMMGGFEVDFARWLNLATALEVSVAQDGEPLTAGRVLVCPGACDASVTPSHRVHIRAAPPLGYHPSVDLLFSSAADIMGSSVVGVVLSGIGNDGSQGAKRLLEKGGVVVVQEPASCPVVGMPEAVMQGGFATACAPPDQLAALLLRHALTGVLSRRR